MATAQELDEILEATAKRLKGAPPPSAPSAAEADLDEVLAETIKRFDPTSVAAGAAARKSAIEGAQAAAQDDTIWNSVKGLLRAGGAAVGSAASAVGDVFTEAIPEAIQHPVDMLAEVLPTTEQNIRDTTAAAIEATDVLRRTGRWITAEPYLELVTEPFTGKDAEAEKAAAKERIQQLVGGNPKNPGVRAAGPVTSIVRDVALFELGAGFLGWAKNALTAGSVSKHVPTFGKFLEFTKEARRAKAAGDTLTAPQRLAPLVNNAIDAQIVGTTQAVIMAEPGDSAVETAGTAIAIGAAVDLAGVAIPESVRAIARGGRALASTRAGAAIAGGMTKLTKPFRELPGLPPEVQNLIINSNRVKAGQRELDSELIDELAKLSDEERLFFAAHFNAEDAAGPYVARQHPALQQRFSELDAEIKTIADDPTIANEGKIKLIDEIRTRKRELLGIVDGTAPHPYLEAVKDSPLDLLQKRRNQVASIAGDPATKPRARSRAAAEVSVLDQKIEARRVMISDLADRFTARFQNETAAARAVGAMPETAYYEHLADEQLAKSASTKAAHWDAVVESGVPMQLGKERLRLKKQTDRIAEIDREISAARYPDPQVVDETRVLLEQERQTLFRRVGATHQRIAALDGIFQRAGQDADTIVAKTLADADQATKRLGRAADVEKQVERDVALIQRQIAEARGEAVGVKSVTEEPLAASVAEETAANRAALAAARRAKRHTGMPFSEFVRLTRRGRVAVDRDTGTLSRTADALEDRASTTTREAREQLRMTKAERIATVHERLDSLRNTLTLKQHEKTLLTRTRKDLEEEVARLTSVRQYPGRADDIRRHVEAMERIDKSLRTHYRFGGTRYIPDMYLDHEAEKTLQRYNLSGPAIRGYANRFTYQKDVELPEGVKQALRHFDDPTYPMATQLRRLVTARENDSLLHRLSLRKEVVSDVEKEGWVLLGKPIAPTATAEEVARLRLESGYGEMYGKWADPNLAREIDGIVQARIEDILPEWYNAGLRVWKRFKTAYNPGTWFRNMGTNVMFLDFAGIAPTRQTGKFREAYGGWRNRDALEHEFISIGGDTGNYAATDLEKFKVMAAGGDAANAGGVFSKIADAAQAFDGKTIAFYSMQDGITRRVAYRHAREELGLSITQAADHMDRFIPNYARVPRNRLTQFAPLYNPFWKFAWTSTPIMLRNIFENPVRMAKWWSFGRALNEASMQVLGIDDNEHQAIREVLPTFLRRSPMFASSVIPFTPMQDRYGRTLAMDMTAFAPGGTLVGDEDLSWITQLLLPREPLMRTTIELVTNNSWYDSRPIYNDGRNGTGNTDAPSERVKKAAMYAYRAGAPNIAGWGLRRMMRAGTGASESEFDPEGRVQAFPLAVADAIFGLKFRAIDPEEQLGKRYAELDRQNRAIDSEIARIARSSRSDAEKGRMIAQQNKVRESVYKKVEQLDDAAKVLTTGKGRRAGGR